MEYGHTRCPVKSYDMHAISRITMVIRKTAIEDIERREKGTKDLRGIILYIPKKESVSAQGGWNGKKVPFD